ncbi:MAG: hypothetical protein JST92_00010 [Deltaproteobacteria bacterium]|nr:hypothetical protein [Deltaproteobacteria bacterium]
MSDLKPRILLHSLNIRPIAQPYGPKGWGPSFSYTLRGQLPSGTQLFTHLDNPDGSEWLTLTNDVNEQGPDDFVNVSAATCDDGLTTDQVGAFPFRIRMVSELEGVDEVLYAGKLVIERTADWNERKQIFRARNDWQLGWGSVQIDLGSDLDAPRLHATMWAGGGAQSHQMAAYLFFNGKKLFSSEVREQIDVSTLLTAPHSDGNGGCTEFAIEVKTARAYINGSYGDMDQWHDLSKHPGKYELKMTREKKLDRTLAFEIGADGKLVSTGFTEFALGTGARMHAPVKVVGKFDDGLDPAASPSAPWYGQAPGESMLTIADLYAQMPAPAAAPSGPSPEVLELIEKSAGRADTIAGWFWDDMQKPGQPIPQCEACIRYIDEAMPKLDELIAKLPAGETVKYRGAQATPQAVKEAMLALKAFAQGQIDGRAQAANDRAALYRAVLKLDKLRIFEDRPAGDYRYYTSGKREIQTPEELAQAGGWYFEGSADQGLITEKWTVKGFKFDADGKLLETIESSAFGTNAPSSAFP